MIVLGPSEVGWLGLFPYVFPLHLSHFFIQFWYST